MKLVKESINFNRSEDPHKALGIGTLERSGIIIIDTAIIDNYYTQGVHISHYVKDLNNYFNFKKEPQIKMFKFHGIPEYEYKGESISYKEIVLLVLEKIKDRDFLLVNKFNNTSIIDWDEIINNLNK